MSGEEGKDRNLLRTIIMLWVTLPREESSEGVEEEGFDKSKRKYKNDDKYKTVV